MSLLFNSILTLIFYILINKHQHSPFHLIVALKLTLSEQRHFPNVTCQIYSYIYCILLIQSIYLLFTHCFFHLFSALNLTIEARKLPSFRLAFAKPECHQVIFPLDWLSIGSFIIHIYKALFIWHYISTFWLFYFNHLLSIFSNLIIYFF